MLASPRNMQDYNGNQFGERTVTDLGSIVDDPTNLLFSASPATRQHNVSASGTGHLDILSASQYPHPLLEQYQQRQASLKRKSGPATGPADQFYGGIVFNNAPESSSNSADEPSNTPMAPRPRKKAKKAAIQDGSDQDNSTKRTRGRPRVDTQDETAADRRRTQIRLAQRAYRHRKETTITSLKQKNSTLQSTIEQMNSAFLTLHDNLMDSGLVNGHRALSSHLKKVMSQFEQLAADAAVEEDDDAPDQPPPPKTTRQKPSKAQRKAAPAPASNISPLQSSQDSDIEELPLVTYSNENGSVDAFDPGPWNDTTSDIMQFNVQIPEAQFPLETGTQKNVLDFMAQSPISRPLISSAPSSNGFYTYSFQETTFARRLHRLCIERAFRNLTSPSTDPARIARTFRFTFCFSNRRRMLARFQHMLKRKAGESLENYNIPFFRIGGAGTHFPRHDKEGRTVSPPNMLGPERAVRTHILGTEPSNNLWGMEIETPRSERSVQELLEQLGFGGLWLDSHDVEQYLKSKGIVLDGTSSFVEVDPQALSLDTDLPNGGNSPSSIDSTPLRTPSPFPLTGNASLDFTGNSPYMQQPLNNLYPNFAETAENPDVAVQDYMSSVEKDFRAQSPTQQIAAVQSSQIWPWMEAAPSFDIDSEQHGDAMFNLNNNVNTTNPANTSASFAGGYAKAPYNFGTEADERSVAQNGMQGARRVVEQLRRTGVPVTVDVERLLERLVDGGACLGRAPGFRKELIDHAVVMSLAEAF